MNSNIEQAAKEYCPVCDKLVIVVNGHCKKCNQAIDEDPVFGLKYPQPVEQNHKEDEVPLYHEHIKLIQQLKAELAEAKELISEMAFYSHRCPNSIQDKVNKFLKSPVKQQPKI